MSFTGIQKDSRLKEIFIGSKNARIGVRMRKIWSSEVGVHREPHYYANPRNSVPEGCRSIFATPVNAVFLTQIYSGSSPLNRIQTRPMSLTWHNTVPKSP